MVRSARIHHEEEDDGDEELVSSQKLNINGKSSGQKANPLRSKHSETEQRRRSKINERFQILMGLIPQNEQKRDKASFLLEVIQYIQFLQAKLDTYEGCSKESTKLVPRRNSTSPMESFFDQPQLMKNVSGQKDPYVVTSAMPIAPQNSVDSDVSEAVAYDVSDNAVVAATQAIPIRVVAESSALGNVSSQPHPASPTDTDFGPSNSQMQFWESRPCAFGSALPSYALNEEELKSEGAVASISNAYSQELLNNITQALQFSGVDLTQASISVQLDVSQQGNNGLPATLFSMKDHQNQCRGSQSRTVHGVGCSCEPSDRAEKRPRT